MCVHVHAVCVHVGGYSGVLTDIAVKVNFGCFLLFVVDFFFFLRKSHYIALATSELSDLPAFAS